MRQCRPSSRGSSLCLRAPGDRDSTALNEKLMKGLDLFFLQPLYAMLADCPTLLRLLERRYGLRPVLRQGEARLGTSELLNLLETLHVHGRPHAGAWLAQRVDVSVAGGLTYYLRSHARLGDAIRELLRLRRHLLPDGIVRYAHDADGIELQLRPAYQEQRLGRVLRYEAMTVWLHELLSRCVATPLPLLAVGLMSPPPEGDSALEAQLGRRIDWLQDHCTIRYAREALDMPLPGHSPALLVALRPMMDEWQLGVAAEASSSIALQVQEWLSRQADLCQVTLDQAAQALARGASTLRRHLHQEGHRFQDLMLAQRRARLFRAVAYGEQPLGQLAAEQGYSDRAGLERAFVNGFGWRPAQLRRTLETLTPEGALRSQAALNWELDTQLDEDSAAWLWQARRRQAAHALDCRLQLARALRHEMPEDAAPGDADLVAALAQGGRWWISRQEAQGSGTVPDPSQLALAAHLLQAARLGTQAVLLRLSRLRLALADQQPDPWADALRRADALVRPLESGDLVDAEAPPPASGDAGSWEALARELWDAGPAAPAVAAASPALDAPPEALARRG